jgi:hypothetical protein
MSFTNSEQLYGVKTAYISGAAGTVNVVSGPGVFFSLVTSFSSGVVIASFSGGIVSVQDGVSGVVSQGKSGTAGGTPL